jgi:hypothetical protein
MNGHLGIEFENLSLDHFNLEAAGVRQLLKFEPSANQ